MDNKGKSLVEEEAHGLAGIDVLLIALYFFLVIGVGGWASFRASTHNAQGYFLAGRSANWILVGLSMFATNVGAPMFIGLAGSAAATGFAVVMFEWHAMFMLLLLGWFFIPVYRSSGCFTMPEYLRMRYGGQRIRMSYACIQIFLTITNHVGGQIFTGALFITTILKWNLYGSIIFVLVITAFYTLVGGLTAVLWTDAIQTVIIVASSFILAALSLNEIGGYQSMKEKYMQAATNYTKRDVLEYGNHTCGLPPENAFHIFRSASDGAYPWPGMILGLTIVCVQRCLSAKSVPHAKAGMLLASYLKTLPFLFFVIPGMIGRILFPEEVACADPESCKSICKNAQGCTNLAYPILVNKILPTGMKGLMLAALLAALMSSLTSIFNSSSTLFTMDIWRFFRPRAKQSELMIVGRVWTVFIMLVSIGWLPLLLRVQGSQFWVYSQSISAFLVPPIAVIFILGMFWNRTTEKGAFCGLLVGLLCGIIRMALEWSIAAPPCGSSESNKQFAVIKHVHYLHFAPISSAVSAIVVVAVSLVTQRRPSSKLRRTTWWTRNDPKLREDSDDSDANEDLPSPLINKDVLKIQCDAEHAFPHTVVEKSLKYLLCKWACGVDQAVRKDRLTKEERQRLQQSVTSIDEDPYWQKVLNINMVLCTTVAIVLHIVWA